MQVLRLLFCCGLFIVWSAHAETLTGRVVSVYDGDTITLLVTGNKQIKVRLAGIDAPELNQSYGDSAKQALSERVFGKDVRVESNGPDRYGRTLGIVNVGTVNANAAMVEQGAAWIYRAYPYPKELEALESQAQASKRGLWALQADQRCPPWDFRHKRCGVTPTVPDAPVPTVGTQTRSCGAKHTCREMVSCEEAKFYLTQCGVKSLDGNGDGVPCNALCRD